METRRCKLVDNDADFQTCVDIRLKVFVEEQSVPEDMELDEFETVSKHFLVTVNGKGITTGRLRPYGSFVKFERIATLLEERGKGTGRVLMECMMDYAERHYPDHLPMMHAQISALGFYEKLGWMPVGDEFDEAGITHLVMIHVPKSEARLQNLLIWKGTDAEPEIVEALKQRRL
ncbi:GNAT family N-acetyltransferase [Corallococcus interemptor]|uniref:GNAT family N-acetyltransferase n=1 Tax=Corallococcus interemptor TaxID=2316720 RepID=UPI003CFDAB29